MALVMPDLYWLAGLLEGEGSFGIHRRKANPLIQYSSTDYDVVLRAATMMETTAAGPYLYGTSKKPVWKMALAGTRAVGWMMTLFSLLGERRKARIKEVLATWKVGPPMWNPWRHTECHPGRVYVAKNLCSSCYNKQYHAARKRELQFASL